MRPQNENTSAQKNRSCYHHNANDRFGFNLRIFYNRKYCRAPGRGIEDVLLKDVRYEGDGEEISVLSGYDEERCVKNIRFENLCINGRAISDRMPDKPRWYKTGDMARIFIGEHVGQVTFDETPTVP